MPLMRQQIHVPEGQFGLQLASFLRTTRRDWVLVRVSRPRSTSHEAGISPGYFFAPAGNRHNAFLRRLAPADLSIACPLSCLWGMDHPKQQGHWRLGVSLLSARCPAAHSLQSRTITMPFAFKFQSNYIIRVLPPRQKAEVRHWNWDLGV